MDVHEMLAVVVSDSTSRRSCDLERKAAEPTVSALSPFASVARHSLDMGSASAGTNSSSSPVAIPRGSLDLPKTSGGGVAGAYSLSRMLSGSIFPGSLSLSRTSTSTYPSRGSASPPLSPASTFGGRATPLAPEYGWAMDKERVGLTTPAAAALGEAAHDQAKPPAAQAKPVLGGGLARCLADLNHLEPMFHMDHMDVETFDRHNT